MMHVQADVQETAGALDHGEHTADVAAVEPHIGAYGGINGHAEHRCGAAEHHIKPIRLPILSKTEPSEHSPVQGLGDKNGREPDRRPDGGYDEPGGAADKGRQGDPCLEFPVSHQRHHGIGRDSHSNPPMISAYAKF